MSDAPGEQRLRALATQIDYLTSQLKRESVAQVDAGTPLIHVAEWIGKPRSTLYRWAQTPDTHDTQVSKGKG